MFVSATLLDGIEDVVNPKFRKISFGDGGPQRTVVMLVRKAWIAKPPEGGGDDPFSHWASVDMNRDAESPVPHINPDKDDVETPWRAAVLKMCKSKSYSNTQLEKLTGTDNHLFYDIGNFLPGVNGRLGHFHSPNHFFFTVSYGEDSMVKVFDTNVVLLPAFLDESIRIKGSKLMHSQGEGSESQEQELDTFSLKNPYEAWWIASGVELRLTIEFDVDESMEVSLSSSKERKGIAAVFVVGRMTDGEHCEAEQAPQEES